MLKLPPVEHIQVFITNRRKWGWTDAYIASELRKRLKWDELDVEGMDGCGRERREQISKILMRMET